MAYNTRELFARLIQCEAGGEGEDGICARKWRFYTRNLHFPLDKSTHCVYNIIKDKERRKAHEWVNMIRKKTRDYIV